MAKLQTLISFSSLFLLFAVTTALDGERVGSKTPIENVESNKEVQDLGKYCVQEYNRQMQQKGNGGKLLMFSHVVEAATQVVSGTKYYLKISASTHGRGGAKTFDVVVVVKPWMHSKELLKFEPSPTSINTK
ncbi:hypothetical protein ACJIZ3_018075 [Penstemon smallii]|uniref:Cystatin domain-containing protein n=1 Tax=Penstemon smallii TaxID=265156 RepID=A0ABD3SYH9_9LAMI